MVKEGALLDDNLTMLVLTTLFSRVNADAAADGSDADTATLSVDEFIFLLALCTNAKYPVENRAGEPFHTTWESFLQLIFVPRYKKLLRNKQQGGRQTIDGKCF